MKSDISQSTFYVKRILNVVKSSNSNYGRFIRVDHRLYDAFSYILSGTCTYRFDDGYEFTVRAGDIMYITHDAKYTLYIHDENYRFIFCDFELDGNEKRKSAVFSSENREYTESLFKKLFHTYSSPSKTSFAECMSLFYKIYGIILTCANREYVSLSARSKIEEAKAYIDANYKSPALSITSLAESINMSEVYFRKLFKSRYDVSPLKYIISIRLKKAKELMEYPFLSLEECALQSGFSSLQYFCRVFKKETGVTPNNYRSKNK